MIKNVLLDTTSLTQGQDEKLGLLILHFSTYVFPSIIVTPHPIRILSVCLIDFFI